MSPFSLASTAKLSTGYSIPLLGFGVYRNPPKTTKESVLEALRAGYRHIDTAQMYGNEAQVGLAVRESGIDRSEIFITSKIQSPDHGYESTLAAVDKSLQHLNIDFIDLYLIHDPLSGKEKRLQTWKALVECKKAGKIRTLGVSNFSDRHIAEIKDAGYEMPSVHQIEFHPWCQMKHIIPYCEKNNIVIEAYCPLARMRYDNDPTLRELVTKYKRESAQILCRWSLQRGYIPLPKSVTPSRIRSNSQLYDFELSKEDMDRLDSLDQGRNGAVAWWPYDAE